MTVCSENAMGWLRLVGSLKVYVSFAEYSLFYRALLQKRPIILSSLLIEASPYHSICSKDKPITKKMLTYLKRGLYIWKETYVLTDRSVLTFLKETYIVTHMSVLTYFALSNKTQNRDFPVLNSDATFGLMWICTKVSRFWVSVNLCGEVLAIETSYENNEYSWTLCGYGYVSVCVCVDSYMCTYSHVYIYTYVYIYICIYVYIHT